MTIEGTSNDSLFRDHASTPSPGAATIAVVLLARACLPIIVVFFDVAGRLRSGRGRSRIINNRQSEPKNGTTRNEMFPNQKASELAAV
jgi:hypothetical protein